MAFDLTLQIQGVIGGAPRSFGNVFRTTDANGDRLVAYILDVHGRNPDGSPRTPKQAADAWSAAVWGSIRRQVQNWERTRAASAAASGVTEIDAAQNPGA